MTILEAIEAAYEEIKVKTLGIPLQSAYITRAVSHLNRMMATLDAKGISMGYTRTTNTAANLTVPDWAEDFVIVALAMRLAPGFGKQISQDTIERYRDARAAVLNMTVSDAPEAYMPETMPVGAGNECGYSGDINTLSGFTGTFFGPLYEDDLVDGNGDIVRDENGTIMEDA